MGYWTCWYESIKAAAPKVVHHFKPTTIHKSAHTGVKHHIHHAHGLASKKAVVAAGDLTLKKVCVYTGTLGALTGGIGAGVTKYHQSSNTQPSTPIQPPLALDPGLNSPDNMFIPPADYGYNPSDYTYNPLTPFGDLGGYISGLGGFNGGTNNDGGHTTVPNPTTPTLPNQNVPEPASYLIFGMGILIFVIVRYLTNKKLQHG
jgi:hypothetical protein